MAGHPAGDRMDGVGHFDPPLLEQLRELARGMLRLRDGQPVARHDDDPLGVGEQRADVFGRGRPDAATLLAGRPNRARMRLAECAEENVRKRAAHRVAHELGENAA